MNKVTYFISLRRAGSLLGLVLLLLASASCASRKLQIVTPYSKHITGPRSFEAIEKAIQEQAQPFRDLYFRVQADYPHFMNFYRLDLVISPDGDVESVTMIERDYVLKDFEDEFMRLVNRMKFPECDCPRTRIIYTFRFASQLPSKAKTEAQLEAERREQERRDEARRAVENEDATLRILPAGSEPLPAPLGPVGEGIQHSTPAPSEEGERPRKAEPRQPAPKPGQVNPDPIPEEPLPDPNAPDFGPFKQPAPPPSGPANPQEIPPSPEIP